MDLQHLTRPTPPWLHVLAGNGDVMLNLERTGSGRTVVRAVRGHKATTAGTLFDEMAAALQFPDYFGENWDAVNDCLADLRWLRADAVVICFTRATELLANAAARDMKAFARVLEHAAKVHNEPKRPAKPVPFHVVWQVAADEVEALEERWKKAGVELHRLG
jgi:RNAse (barnase) inhibitor barstar